MNHYQSCSNFPLVSVIIPAFNAARFITETLESVLSQTYRDIEVLVVDDGSQDHTAERVESFARKDPRVLLIKQANQGVAAARNLAIEQSRGEYIAPIDADDLWYPQKLEKQVQLILESKSSVGLVYTWSACINEQGLLTGRALYSNKVGDVYLDLLAGNFISNSSSPLIRRVCFEEIGGYNFQMKEQDAQGCEDWDIYLRVAERYQFQVVPEFLVGYRQTIGSMSCNYAAMAKSHSIMMDNAKQRNPNLPNRLIHLSKIKFYLYLADKSTQCEEHGNTLLLFFKLVTLDTALLLNKTLYKRAFMSVSKLVLRSLATLFRLARYSWPTFQQEKDSNNRVYIIPDLVAKVGASAKLPNGLRRKWLSDWNQAIKQYCQDAT